MVGGMEITRRGVDRRVTGWLDWTVEHWLALCNGLMAVYVALPLAAPALMALGWSRPASWIYVLYSYSCHQLPSHSWFPFGYQMAYCQRDTALYGAMLVGGLAYARQRLWTGGLAWWVFALLALPIAVDGGTALFGLRESSPLLRTMTGALFGLATAWFVYPLMDRALAQFGSPHEPTTGTG
jgi:uncharacterized membrane protein